MALTIINALEATTSRLEKEEILKQNSTNLTLKEAFRLALDPLVNFYIKKLPEPDASKGVIQPPELKTLDCALHEIKSKLCSRLLRGHDARDHVAWLLGVLTKDDQEVLRRVLGRNLKCGVSEATVEKIWPDLKLSYPCMLVSPLNDKTKIKFPCIAQTKMDGMRFNAICEKDAVSYRTRAGKELDLFGALDDDVRRLAAGLDCVLDGELLMVAGHGGLFTDRKTGNGLLTKFQKGTGTAELAKRVRAVVWDVIPLADFRTGRCDLGYEDRLKLLGAKSTMHISVARSDTVTSMEEAQEIYRHKLDDGEEGLVLKEAKAPWEDKRVKHQVKMKAELEADLLVTGFLPGAGKFEAKIGSLLIESADGKVKSAVGTGLDDDERSYAPSEFLGKIVAVKYNALITDKKTGQKSLFLPVFVEIRDDKKVADTL
jgi:ATP-dependent DNA ligase